MQCSMQVLLDSYVGKEVQLRFAGEVGGPPVGPGMLETFKVGEYTFYRLTIDAALQAPNARPVKVRLPLVFPAESVLWLAEPPQNAEGEKLVQEVGDGGRRTPGGLHIPGQ